MMTTFSTRPNTYLKKASMYFLKMHSELDLEKYRFAKYQDLFKLSSFQNMHDADLAYHKVYHICAENASSKESLLNCLENKEKFFHKHPRAFNDHIYLHHVHKAISEIKYKLNSGILDHLFF
jgi:hypothetical protein